MPLKLLVTFSDEKTDSFNVPIEAWYLGNNYTLPIYDQRKINKVVIDPDHVMPDINRDNNVWENKNGATGK